MTRYHLAIIARPVLLVWLLVELYVAFVLQSITLFGILAIPTALFDWYTRCTKCKFSIGFDKSNYLNMLLLKPNRICTVCGNNNDDEEMS
jgi:hypothetical protein